MGKMISNGISYSGIGGGSSVASDISYDNTVSGLESTDVQNAIDTLADKAESTAYLIDSSEIEVIPTDPYLTESSIVDNVSSSNVTQPLSANQGRLLDKKIDTNLSSIENINKTIANAIYLSNDETVEIINIPI